MRPRASRLLDLLAQRLEDPAVEGDVVKGFPDDRLGDGSRLFAVATEDNDAGIVVFHRQSPVVLRPSHFAYVFAMLEPDRWNVNRGSVTSWNSSGSRASMNTAERSIP